MGEAPRCYEETQAHDGRGDREQAGDCRDQLRGDELRDAGDESTESDAPTGAPTAIVATPATKPDR